MASCELRVRDIAAQLEVVHNSIVTAKRRNAAELDDGEWVHIDDAQAYAKWLQVQVKEVTRFQACFILREEAGESKNRIFNPLPLLATKSTQPALPSSPPGSVFSMAQNWVQVQVQGGVRNRVRVGLELGVRLR